MAAAVAKKVDVDRARRQTRTTYARGKLVTEITYINRKGQRVPISIEQHVFKYHITIQYLGD